MDVKFGSRAAFVLVFTLLCIGSSAGQKQTPKPTRPASDQTNETVFIFQNNFWINLHHFLRGESRRQSLNMPLQQPLAALGVDERLAWQSALDAYVGIANLNSLDQQLVRIDNVLTRLKGTTSVRSNRIDPKLRAALNAAEPVYRAHQWDEHSKENELWITAHVPAITQHGQAIKQAIANALETRAPRGPILVDLARDIGPYLAYTTEGPKGTAGHTVVAPQKNSDPDVALNTIFHEISHTMDSQITLLVDKEARRQGVKVPPDLWHAITLYTTSEIVKRELGRQADPTYHLDADRVQMFKRNGWAEILNSLEKYWKPYLDGNVLYESALHDVVLSVAR